MEVYNERNLKMRLNQFSIGDVVTNNDGEIFEIKQIFSTGNVKVFVKECDKNCYSDVNWNYIKSGKTYTVNFNADNWYLVSPKSSNVSNQSIKDLQSKIQDAEKTVQSLQKTISEQKTILETMKKSEKRMECWKMYEVETYDCYWRTLIVTDITSAEYICRDSDFDRIVIRIDDVESFEEITTTKAKNICKALKEFSEME